MRFLRYSLVLALIPLVALPAPAGAADDPGWGKVRALLSSIQDAYSAPPALTDVVTTGYTAGLLLGNGDMHVISDARDHAQTFYLAKTDFQDATSGQLPLARLDIRSPGDDTSAVDPAYRQQQDILNAEVRGTQTIGGQVVHTRTWEADGENLLVTELSTDSARVPVQVDLTSSSGTPAVAGDGQVSLSRATGADGASGWVSKAAASTRVLGASAVASTVSATGARLAFDLEPRRPVRIVTSVNGNGSYANPQSLADITGKSVTRVAGIDRRDVDRVQAAHREWWKQFWLKSYVDTGDALLNKYYYGALYAEGAASRAGFIPPGTYSPWRASAGQANRYYLNYNTEAQYFGMYSANRAELAKPYYDLIQAEMPYVRNTTHAAGYQGLTFKRSFGPYDMRRPAPAETPVGATKKPKSLPSDQQTNGTYAAIPFLWDYEYTGNLDFYRSVTYPFMKELGAFWVDFVVKDPATGKYIVKDSAVNEGGHDVNSVYDLGYLRRVLTALLDGSRTLGVDQDLRARWQEVLDNLTPYPEATMDGLDVILLASEISNPIKGNALLNKNDQPINLEGVVFPSDNLAVGGDPDLLRKVRNTLTWVDPFKPGTRGSSFNGFPKTFPIAARVGWPAEDLIGKFKTVIGNLIRPNLTVRQSGGGQETSGSIETINSMFLQTYQGVNRVFPNWPSARDAEFTRLRAKGAFLLSSRLRAGLVSYVDVHSDVGDQFTLANPWGTTPVDVTDSSGRPIPHTPGTTITFPTRPNATYHLTPSCRH